MTETATPAIIWYPPVNRVVVNFEMAPDWREKLIARLESGLSDSMTEPEASMVVTVEELDA